MYAVIKTGGKQYRVERGSDPRRRAPGRRADGEVELTPGAARRRRHRPVHPGPAGRRHGVGPRRGRGQGPQDHRLHVQEQDATTSSRWGHRQHYSTIEITGIIGRGLRRRRHVEDQRWRFHPQRPRFADASASASSASTARSSHAGTIIVRQRGTRIHPGENVGGQRGAARRGQRRGPARRSTPSLASGQVGAAARGHGSGRVPGSRLPAGHRAVGSPPTRRSGARATASGPSACARTLAYMYLSIIGDRP